MVKKRYHTLALPVINRPGVAGVVLQKPLLLINYFINSTIHPFLPIFKTLSFYHCRYFVNTLASDHLKNINEHFEDLKVITKLFAICTTLLYFLTDLV